MLSKVWKYIDAYSNKKWDKQDWTVISIMSTTINQYSVLVKASLSWSITLI